MVSSNFPSRPFRLEEQVDTSSNWDTYQTTARGRMWIRKNSYSPTYSFQARSSYAFALGGEQLAANSFGYDFRNSDELQLCDVYKTFNHDANGNLSFDISGWANVDQMGYTSVSSQITMPRIPRPPDAPVSVGLDQITSSTMRYRFSGSGSDGGSAITKWEIRYWETGQPQEYRDSTGTSVVTGLKPATIYNFESRGHNGRGAGPWSSPIISAQTLATAPSAPRAVAAAATPPATVDVTWQAPASTGGKPITLYQVQISSRPDFLADMVYRDVNASTRSVRFQNEALMKPGALVYARVIAKNDDAFSPWAGASPVQIPAGGKVWNGTGWIPRLGKVWDGSTWKVSRIKTWTGTEWKAAK